MMERLTENFLGCYQIKGCDNFTCEETCNNVLNCGCCPISEAINKLAEYEDAEEQGLLLRLPCKVGDTVYFIYNNEVHHEEVKRFFQCNGAKNWGIVLWGMYPDLYFDQIGKTVFLTQAEAEQKLKEMNTNNGITE